MNMKAMMGAVALTMLASTAVAQEKRAYRPRYEASPEVQERFAAQKAAAIKPIRRGDPIDEARPERTAVGELVRAEDGMVMIRRKLSQEQLQAMLQRGVPKMTDPDRIVSPAVHGDYFYTPYVAAEGVELTHLEGRTQRDVRLVLVLTEARRYRVKEASFVRE